MLTSSLRGFLFIVKSTNCSSKFRNHTYKKWRADNSISIILESLDVNCPSKFRNRTYKKWRADNSVLKIGISLDDLVAKITKSWPDFANNSDIFKLIWLLHTSGILDQKPDLSTLNKQYLTGPTWACRVKSG